MGTPPLGELNTRGVAEYSDFGPIERLSAWYSAIWTPILHRIENFIFTLYFLSHDIAVSIAKKTFPPVSE